MKTIEICPKPSLSSKNSESLLVQTNSIGFKYAQACGYFPLSINYNSARNNHQFLTFPHTFLLNYTRLLLVGQSCWLLIYLLNQIRLFYSSSDFQFTITYLGHMFWALIGVGLFIAIRVKRLCGREETLFLWTNITILHEKLLQHLSKTQSKFRHSYAFKRERRWLKIRVILCILSAIICFIVDFIYKIVLPLILRKIEDPVQNGLSLIWAMFVVLHTAHAVALLGFMNFFTTCFKSLYDSFCIGNSYMNKEYRELLHIFKELETLVAEFNLQYGFDFSATIVTCTLQISLGLFNLLLFSRVDQLVGCVSVIIVLTLDLWAFCSQGSYMTRYASQVVELFEKVSFKTFDSDLKTQVSFL